MEKKIGEVWVDSGLVWLGDPCYVLGQDASHGVRAWDEFVAKLYPGDKREADDVTEALGEGIGLAVQTTHGDGTYPVYGIYGARGELTGIRVDFDPLTDDWADDDYDLDTEDE